MLRPAWPDRCPFHDEAGPGPCRLGRVRDRERKTGPRFPLLVLRCDVHRHAFTLYPPGFAPYLRQPVLTLSPDGSERLSEETADPKARLRSDFGASIFDAAFDAAEGRAWDRSSLGGTVDRFWGNQLRRLDAGAKLAGVAAETPDGNRDQIAHALTVDVLLLRDEAAMLRAVPGYRRLGTAIVTVLGSVLRSATRALRLLVAGYLAGRWGMPLQWDPGRRCLFSIPFLTPGTGPPP